MNCADHVPVFRNLWNPASIVLEPFPNRQVRSMCVAGGALVTVHRNGIRIYRQRYLTATQMGNVNNNNNNGAGKNVICNGAPEIRTGLWEVVECRDNFHFRDAYLSVGAELVFNRGRILPLRWSRYLAVACGVDRTHFSVCVLSTAAHFVLHHELHEKNKVVALNFALVAMETKPDSRRYQPFVVSVDEVGEVVIFDVEHDRAVKLVAFPAAFGTPTTETFTDDSSRESQHHVTAGNDANNKGSFGGGDKNAVFSAKNKCTHAPMLDSPTNSSGGGGGLRPYRLDAGLASNVCLVGPCQVYCKRCGDAPFVPGSLVMSLYISSRANGTDGQAELHVMQLRFRWTFFPPRAVLISETPIVRESAPEDVCEIGVAMLRVPFHENLPQSFMIGRPRLRFWSLSGCTGKLLQLHRVYHDTDGSGKGARGLKEHFVSVVPLGRHVLVQDATTSWLCMAALTNDDVILLLGKEPLSARRDSSEDASRTPSSVSIAPEVLEKQTLELWLDEVERQNQTQQPEVGQKQEQEQQTDETNPLHSSRLSVKSSLTVTSPNQDYTVLMVLAAPGTLGGLRSSSSRKSFLSSRVLTSLPQSNELLFFMTGSDEIYSIKLPFEWSVASDGATQKEVTTQKPWGNLRGASGGWMDVALNATFLSDLQIARPLISAVWGLAGKVELDETSLPPLTARSQQQQQEEHAPGARATKEDVNERSLTSCAVVPVHIDGDNRQSVRKKKRRTGVSSVGSVGGRTTDDEEEEDANVRRAYVDAERHKILTTGHLNLAEEDQREGGFCVGSDALFAQMITGDEPLQRNAIIYEWSDAHDDMYVQFIQEGQEAMERERACDTGHNVFFSKWTSQQSLRERFTLSDFNECVHSAGFMQAFRDAQRRRQKLRDKGGLFDFAAYFATNVVPQQVLTLQEEDRCRFELEDLKVAFEDDMKKLQEVETVVVYENEERRMDRDGRWRWLPHETFPFDDEGGNAVDIATLNLTVALPKAAAITPGAVAAAAGMLTSSTPSGWRWANDTTDAHAPRYGAFKMHRRELQSWQAGKWMYAERWPSREEEQQGTFQWSSTAGAGVANVRRRCLSRNRINIAIEAAKEARHQEYLKKLEQLRMELGL